MDATQKSEAINQDRRRIHRDRRDAHPSPIRHRVPNSRFDIAAVDSCTARDANRIRNSKGAHHA
jgi:hypothetical protein